MTQWCEPGCTSVRGSPRGQRARPARSCVPHTLAALYNALLAVLCVCRNERSLCNFHQIPAMHGPAQRASYGICPVHGRGK